MCCLECGAEFDEMNESQPVCPGCGALPVERRDSVEISALLDEAAFFASTLEGEEDQGEVIDLNESDSLRLPAELQEAADDAKALLEGTGHLTFDHPQGFRFFKLPTGRLM